MGALTGAYFFNTVTGERVKSALSFYSVFFEYLPATSSVQPLCLQYCLASPQLFPNFRHGLPDQKADQLQSHITGQVFTASTGLLISDAIKAIVTLISSFIAQSN